MSSNKKVIIHYLFHSGFTVEYGDYFLVFDYYPPPDGTLIPEFSKRTSQIRLQDIAILLFLSATAIMIISVQRYLTGKNTTLHSPI